MNKHPFLKNLPMIIGVAIIIIAAILAYVFREYFQKPTESKKQVQKITVVQPPPQPPPPPPPKPEIKPPEVKEEKLPDPEPEPEPTPETPEPEPEAADAPAGEELGVDAEGGSGGDGFGLVGKKGGKGLIGGGGGGGNAFIWYGQHVQKELLSELDKTLKDRAREVKYSAVVHIWIDPNGDISRVELANSSGTAEVDNALRKAISEVKGHLKPPPDRMPQPLKIRIRS